MPGSTLTVDFRFGYMYGHNFFTVDICFTLSQVFSEANNECLAETHCQRIIMAEGVRRIPIAQGNICNGTLFLPPEKTFGSGPYPLAVQLFGGIQKGKVFEEQSALIAARAGVACFSMAYFGVNNLPKSYLGYATNAIFVQTFNE